MPLPSDETTPPVTNMNLVMFQKQRSVKQPGDTFEIRRRIHAKRIVFRFDHADGVTVFNCAQLFEALALLEGTDGQIGIGKKQVPTVDVKSDMLEPGQRARTCAVANIRNRQ